MMNKRMENVCRAAVSTVAGVDNRTMAEVAAMRMKSAGAVAAEENIVNEMMVERTKASADFSF